MNTPPTTPQKTQEKTQEIFTYASAVSKGQRMHDITLENSCPPSMYHSQNDLTRWGWSRSTASRAYNHISQADHRYLVQACIRISGGTSKEIDATFSMSDMHDKEFFPNCIKRPFTMAYIFSSLNPKARLLIASVNTTPENMHFESKKRLKMITFPELSHWSDVAFLQWQSLSVDGVIPTSSLSLEYKSSTTKRSLSWPLY